MNEAYVQGFIQKCAEAGVDPEVLVKMAVRGEQLGRLLALVQKAKGAVLVPELVGKKELSRPGQAEVLANRLRLALEELTDFDFANAAIRRSDPTGTSGIRGIPELGKLFRGRKFLKELAPIAEQAQAVRNRLGLQ